MKVDKSTIRTPDEEIAHLRYLLAKNGAFLVWEEHPNVAKTRMITDKRLRNKIEKLVASDEWQDSNP